MALLETPETNVTQGDLGDFADLVPQQGETRQLSAPTTADFGEFADLIPPPPPPTSTPATDEELAKPMGIHVPGMLPGTSMEVPEAIARPIRSTGQLLKGLIPTEPESALSASKLMVPGADPIGFAREAIKT